MPPLPPRPPRRAEAVRDTLWRFGYIPTALPLVADADLFLNVAGDAAITTLLDFEHNGHVLALRPEFTALSARHYAQQHRHNSPALRWQFQGPVFALAGGASPMRAQREHIGAEVLGVPASLADGEVLALAAMCTSQAYDTPMPRMEIGHAGVLRSLLHAWALDARTTQLLLAQLVGAPRDVVTPVRNPYTTPSSSASHDTPPAEALYDAIAPAVQRGQAMGGRTQRDITQRLVHKQQRAATRRHVDDAVDTLNALHAMHGAPAQVLPALRRMTDNVATLHLLDDWSRALEQAETLGLPLDAVRLRPGLVRSWEYYSGILFDVRSSQDVLLVGGGRYDGLMALVDPARTRGVPAVGFTLALPDDEPAPPAPLSLVSPSQHTDVQAQQWATWLREAQLAVALLREAPDDATPLTLGEDGALQAFEHSYAWEERNTLLDRLTGLSL